MGKELRKSMKSKHMSFFDIRYVTVLWINFDQMFDQISISDSSKL